MKLNSFNGTLVDLPGRAFLLSLTVVGALVLSSCQKKETYNETADNTTGLKSYSSKVGASPRVLLDFHKSLSKLRSSDGSSSAPCLKNLQDEDASRNAFLQCLSQKGLSGLNKEFLEELVGVRLGRMHIVHEAQAAKTLRLLNWIFDLSLEQYALSKPKSYWLLKDAEGNWRFTDKEQKNQDDFDFEEGDLVLSISPTELSTLIPQYSYPQRRLTHSMMYRGERGNRRAHFVESEFEEGVRFKYRDVYREKDKPFETITLRYKDPALSPEKLARIRRNASDFAASRLGVPYGFTTDPKDGFACHFLTGLSYADAVVNTNGHRKELGFEDLKIVLTDGFSPMRQGPSRIYASKFGMADHITEYPTAGDFLTSSLFEPVAVFVRPDVVQKFSDLYTVAEALVDALDRGSEMKISDSELKAVEPMLRDRHKLSELIGMARKLKRHTLVRESMSKANVSVERVDEMTVKQLKEVLDRLDDERRVLIRAAKDEIGLNILPNAFGKAIDIRRQEKEGKTKYFSMGDFLLSVQADREAKVLEYNEYAQSQRSSDQKLGESLKELQDYLKVLAHAVETRSGFVRISDEEFDRLRTLAVKVNFRLIDKDSDHLEIDKMINKVVVGFDEKDFDQLQLFIDNLKFDDFKDIVNLGSPKTYTAFYAPSRPVYDPNYKPSTYENKSHFTSELPVFGDVLSKMDKLQNDGKIEDAEIEELETYLRVYARFLLSIPSLKKKLAEYDNREEELQKIIKNTPYIASALSNETLIEFGLYKTVASKVVEKLDKVRAEELKISQLWQMPPWIQRSWIELIFSGVPVMHYVP